MARVDFKDVTRETRTFANMQVPVSVVPRFKKQSYPKRFVFSFKSLLEGMRLTFGYLIRPSKVVTQQYPENRATLKFPERYRANLKLKHDENGYHGCTGCGSCERACPNGSIVLQTKKGEISGKNELDRYIWRMDSCVFCNACVEVCPFDALEMSHEFENAVYDRRLLIYTLNRYSGPTANALMKQEDPQVRASMIKPVDVYGGPVPMSGHSFPAVRGLGVKEGGEKI